MAIRDILWLFGTFFPFWYAVHTKKNLATLLARLKPRAVPFPRNCPICKSKIAHTSLRKLLDPIDVLYDNMKKKAIMRLEYKGLSKCEAVTTKGAR
jgi:hypothetical protein